MIIPIEINLEGLDINLKDLEIKVTIKKSDLYVSKLRDSQLSKLRKFLVQNYNLTEFSKARYWGFKNLKFSKNYLIILELYKQRIRVSIHPKFCQYSVVILNPRFPKMPSFILDFDEVIPFIENNFRLEKN